MINVIAQRELKSIFYSPLAWIVLGITQFILAWTFLANIERFLALQPQLAALSRAPGVTDVVVAPIFSLLGVLMLLTLPLLTMRLLSEEYRNQTFVLLAAAPVSSLQIVLGKYLAIAFFITIILMLPASMCLLLQTGTTLDLGQLAAMLCGVFLLLASCTAIGLYFSSLTIYPGIAAMSTFGILLMLWVIDGASSGTDGTTTLDPILSWLSITQHQGNFMRGVIDSRDCAYYFLLIILFLLLSVRRLEARRLHD